MLAWGRGRWALSQKRILIRPYRESAKRSEKKAGTNSWRSSIERFSLDCRKTKTKVNTCTSQPKGVVKPKPKPKPIPFHSQVKTALTMSVNPFNPNIKI